MELLQKDFPVHFLTPLTHPELKIWEVPQRPPSALRVQGRPEALRLLEKLPSQGLGVVGTRSPLARSIAEVRRILSPLKGSSLILVSGFAKGIDAECHKTAIKVGLPTIAVLGTPLEMDYPKENFWLRRKILEAGGLLISEYDPGTSSNPGFFLFRNRLIASWSKAVWIVEAGKKSGALNTAKWAGEFYRDCFVTPCFPGDPCLAGNQNLLENKQAYALWSAYDFKTTWLELSPQFQKPSPSSKSAAPDVQLLVQKVHQLQSHRGGVTVDQIFEWSMELQWPSDRFFEALQTALTRRFLLDENGLLLKNLERSD